MAQDIQNSASSVNAFSDLEWSGKVNRSLGQGRSFALLLSMLESNTVHRVRVATDDEYSSLSDSGLKSMYRTAPLATSDKDWQLSDIGRQTFLANQTDGMLFQAMHPQPLSLYNDAQKIPAEVHQNCSFNTQQRLKSHQQNPVDANPTLLYDVLEDIQSSPVF